MVAQWVGLTDVLTAEYLAARKAVCWVALKDETTAAKMATSMVEYWVDQMDALMAVRSVAYLAALTVAY